MIMFQMPKFSQAGSWLGRAKHQPAQSFVLLLLIGVLHALFRCLGLLHAVRSMGHARYASYWMYGPAL